ncbi:hypothetical protein EV121DRAFT_272976 [Schizophyllum commune]
MSENPGPPQPKKPSRRGMQATIERQAQAIDDLQRQVAEQDNERRKTLGELKNLQNKTRSYSGRSDDSDSDAERPPRKRQNKSAGTEDKTALHAAKKVTLCHQMWTEPAAIELLAPAQPQDADDNADEIGNATNVDEKAMRDAELIKSVCPPHILQRLNFAEVRRQVKEGQRTMRTATVDVVLRRVQDVFDVSSADFPSKEFEVKAKRAKLPKVQQLLKDNRFLYDRDLKTPGDRLAGFMRGVCIKRVQILRVALYGQAAVLTGKPAHKARATNAKLMCVREVTLPMLAFAATIAYFVLSAASELSEAGSNSYEFGRFYRDQLDNLEDSMIASATSKQRNERLLSDYNKDLFPRDGDAEEPDDQAKDKRSYKDALAGEASQEQRQQSERDAMEREERIRRAEQENTGPNTGDSTGTGGEA